MVKYFRFASIIADKGLHNDRKLIIHVGIRAFSLNRYTRQFSLGAGYKGGATLYACWNCVTRDNRYKPTRKLRIGITRNCNNVPYTRH